MEKKAELSPDEITNIKLVSNLPREKRMAFVKKIYGISTDENRSFKTNEVDRRISLIRILEKLTRDEFENTRDLKTKVENYLQGYDGRRLPVSERIRRARRRKKWTQQQLAHHLGMKSHVPIAQYETGVRYPTKEVFKWLEEQGM